MNSRPVSAAELAPGSPSSSVALACAVAAGLSACAATAVNSRNDSGGTVEESSAMSREDHAPVPGPVLPPTRVDPVHETLFGVESVDPYRWLEDWSNPEVRAWTDAQDKVARDWLSKLPGRSRLEARFKELAYVDVLSIPYAQGGRLFYMRRNKGQEKSVLFWQEGESGEPRVLIDPLTLSEDGSKSLGMWTPSPDGKKLAYAIKMNNADEATLFLMDVDTGVTRPVDVIEGAKYAYPDWLPDSSGFYYTFLPTDQSIPVDERPGTSEVRFHALGADPKNDPVIYPRTGNPRTFLGSDLSKDGRWLFITVRHGWNSSDVYYRDERAVDKAFKPLVVGVQAQFGVTAWKDRFYISTNENAPNGKVLQAAPGETDRTRWQELIPEQRFALEGMQIIGDHLMLSYVHNATSRVELRTLEGAPVRELELPGMGSLIWISGQPDSDVFYYGTDSFTIPMHVRRGTVGSAETTIWSRVEIPVDPSPFEVEQVWYPSRDGTPISMFILRRKDMPRDGSTPVILTGYGGFNVNMTPTFGSSWYPWLEAGGAWAIPNLRGGGEYGESWHQAGMLDKKQNVFDDFIAAAEFLVREGYTKPERLGIKGGSNGGLLVGAAMVQRPDLFRAVICAVPLLDMVRYHLFGSGRTWIPEYGSAENEADFKWIYPYSPYQHVKLGTAYPSMLMLAADSDDRVDPMHARKFTALVQAASSSRLPVVMRVERNAGHGGADLVSQGVALNADSMAYAMFMLGLVPAPADTTSSPR